jgi:hypothetical protein
MSDLRRAECSVLGTWDDLERAVLRVERARMEQITLATQMLVASDKAFTTHLIAWSMSYVKEKGQPDKEIAPHVEQLLNAMDRLRDSVATFSVAQPDKLSLACERVVTEHDKMKRALQATQEFKQA